MNSQPKERLTGLIKQRMNLKTFNRSIIISLKNRFVFSPVPKVANSSLKHLIYRMESFPHPSVSIKDNSIHDIHYGPVIRPSMLGFESNLLKKVLFDEGFFRFIFVRNPYARTLSTYLDRYQNPGSGVRNQINKVAIELGLLDNPVDTVDFPAYLRALERIESQSRNDHLLSQSTNGLFDLVKYDFVGSFESLTEDVTEVSQTI